MQWGNLAIAEEDHWTTNLDVPPQVRSGQQTQMMDGSSDDSNPQLNNFLWQFCQHYFLYNQSEQKIQVQSMVNTTTSES